MNFLSRLCNDYPCYGALEIVGAITIIIIINLSIHFDLSHKANNHECFDAFG